jgi:restriction system protein
MPVGGSARRRTEGSTGVINELVERGATKGVFVTTSQFATAAKAYAGRIPQRLVLIGGDELTRLNGAVRGWGQD